MTKQEIEQVYRRHADTVYRVCYTYMKGHRMDLEDAVQTTFVRLMRCGKRFVDAEHEKAWLITVARNVCLNMLKKRHRKDEALADAQIEAAPETGDVMQLVLTLPEDERIAVYLHYYEGYTAGEIGAMIGKKESTVWGYMHRGRKHLAVMLKEETQ